MLSTAKTELRRRVRAQLARMSPAARAAASESIRTTIASMPRWQEARTVAAFVPLPSEPDIRPFDLGRGRTLLLPRVECDTLVFHAVASAANLRTGAFGILEPDPAVCPVVDPAQPDIILVPGLAFTHGGTRLGRGRGFYDRLLASIPRHILRVGVCFSCQIAAEIPSASHDEPADLVVHENATR
jgi:5-formyltetrahydrofolate cyclo-ligase